MVRYWGIILSYGSLRYSDKINLAPNKTKVYLASRRRVEYHIGMSYRRNGVQVCVLFEREAVAATGRVRRDIDGAVKHFDDTRHTGVVVERQLLSLTYNKHTHREVSRLQNVHMADWSGETVRKFA